MIFLHNINLIIILISALTALLSAAFLLRPRKFGPSNPTSHTPQTSQDAPQSTNTPQDDTNINSAKKIDPRAKWKAYNPLDPDSDSDGIVRFKSRLACQVYKKQVSILSKKREFLHSQRDQFRNILAQTHTLLKRTNVDLDNVNYRLSNIPHKDGYSRKKIK